LSVTGPAGLDSPTIFEVAAAAGVSITTVSHVFSGKRPVSEDTRQRVIEVSKRLSYQPHRNAQALATGKTMALAIQLPMLGTEIVFNPYFNLLLPAISQAAVALGYTFILVPPRPSEAAFIEPVVRRRGADAAILIDPVPNDAFARALLLHGVPLVSLGRLPDAPDRPRVDQDFPAAMSRVLRHLRDQGYRRPALLTIPDPLSTIQDIRTAFELAAPTAVVAVAQDFSDGAATVVAERLLTEDLGVDAIVCLTERQAIGVYRAAELTGREIPGELGVVSLGDSSVGQRMDPSLTSLRVFPERAGEALVTRAHEIISGQEVPEVTLVPTRLLVRDSTRRAGSHNAAKAV